MKVRALLGAVTLIAALATAASGWCGEDGRKPPATNGRVTHSDAEWRKLLTPEQYRVLRQKETERPFTGKYWNWTGEGVYCCAGCGQELFRSSTKFDAGCGWPSFWQAIDPSKIELREDDSMGMHRIEVLCRRCGGHLGHLFHDGPKPTGLRFCINSASLVFKKAPGRKP